MKHDMLLLQLQIELNIEEEAVLLLESLVQERIAHLYRL